MNAAAAAPPKLSLRTRFNAWWEGYDPPAADSHEGGEARAAEGAAKPPPRPTAAAGLNRHGKPLWTASRIEVSESLWGKGFTTPGGSDYVPYLVRPLGLNPAMSVLELGAGLGGICRTIAEKYGCWVTGLEGSPILAKLGMERSTMAGLAKQAPIQPFDPEHFQYDKRVDAIICRETLFTIANKNQLFDGLEAQLKPRGQVLLTDYVLDPSAKLEKLERWAAHEPQEPMLWTERDAAEAFAQRNLDLRISEDITDTHKTSILTALNVFTQKLSSLSMDKETKIHVLEEIELWARRVSVFDSGLRVFRFYALKPNIDA